MTDPTPEATPPQLTPANQNPWYVLATLYGEQEGEEIDRDLHDRNRVVWNAWSFHKSGIEEVEGAAPEGFPVEELAAWHTMEQKVTLLHEKEWRRRNGADVPYPGLPDVAKNVDFEWIAFSNTVVMASFIFRSAVIFNDSLFGGDAHFDQANFFSVASFKNAVFSKRARFAVADFGGLSAFAGAAFFGGAWFSGATFTETTWFMKSKFFSIAVFDSATFNRQAFFNEANFGKVAGQQCVFFNDCQFDMSLNFRNAQFRARYPVFSGAITAERNVFTAKPENWPSATKQDPEQAR